jgi:hypothetical protein
LGFVKIVCEVLSADAAYLNADTDLLVFKLVFIADVGKVTILTLEITCFIVDDAHPHPSSAR